MSVTVIIINWNSGDMLKNCLLNLSRQTHKPDRVLILDNASSDGSAEHLEIPLDFDVQRMETNLGFAQGNNICLSRCSTEFVALLNPDAYPDPGWLEHLLAAAEQYPEAAAFGSRQMCQGDQTLLDGLGDVYHVSGLVWREGYGKRFHVEDLSPRGIFSPCAAAAMYRRKALMDAGGFDPDFFCYVEDVDLGFRLRLLGFNAMYVPDAVVYHVGSGTTGGGRSDFSLYHGHRNLVWTYVKNMPASLFWIMLPIHMSMNIIAIIWFSLQGRGGIILRAKLDAVKGLPRMWEKRFKVQALRKVSLWRLWQQLDKRLMVPHG